MIEQREHLNQWAKSLLVCTLFLLSLAGGWLLAPAPAQALTNCDGAAAAPCVEEPALDICVQCHSIAIYLGNRDGTGGCAGTPHDPCRFITKSSSVERHVWDPRAADWTFTVGQMVGKGAGGGSCDQACQDKIAAYLNTNYCVGCNGPIMSSVAVSGLDKTVATIGWATEALATSCVQYGTTNPPTGDTCNASDPNFDANNATLVAGHSVALANLTPKTKYYVIHRSVANGQTATYKLAKAFTTLDDTPILTGGPGTIISLAVGDYNNDQKLDLAAGASTLNTVVSYLGNGLGGFTEGQTLANVGVKPLSITTGGVKGDFNGDTVADLAVGNFGEVANNVLSNANIAIFLGTGSATPVPNPNAAFGSTPVEIIALTDSPTAVAPGDFDGDGKLDLAVATVNLDASVGRILIFKGDGTGHFNATPIATIPVKIKPPTVTITAITDSACLATSPTVTVTGSKLMGTDDGGTYFLDDVTELQIQSVAADNTSVVLRLPVTTPGSHTITAHLGTDSASGTFTVTPRSVTITSVAIPSVTYGITGDRGIQITGTGFVLGSTITVGSLSGTTVSGSSATATTPFVFVNSTDLRFWWPNTSLAPGAYNVAVTNTDNCAGSAMATGAFTVTPPQPTVTSTASAMTYGISASGSFGILGTNFLPGAIITVGGLTGPTVVGTIASATTPFVYQNSTHLAFWWPNTSLTSGTYAVQVTNPAVAGGLSATLTPGFTVLAPQPTVTSTASAKIYGVSASGSFGILGTNFIPGATITVGGLSGPTVVGTIASATTPFVYSSSGTLYFWWPNTSLTPGTYGVQVTNPAVAGGLSATLTPGFTVTAPQPTVSSVTTPKTYGISASTAITVLGTNFVPGATITVGTLSGVTKTSAECGGATTATVTCPFFYSTSTALYFWWSNTSLTPGTYAVQVANPAAGGGLSATLTPGFTVTAPQPTVTSTSPASVTYGITASRGISITGTNFVLGATITVDGLTGPTVTGTSTTVSATTPFVYVSSTTLYFWWPNTSVSPGAYTVQVANPAAAGGLSASKASGFTVIAPQPTVSSASPTPVTYGVTVSKSIAITGTNFLLGSTITIQGPAGTLSGVTVSGSAATSTIPFVYTTSSSVKFWWGNTSLPAGTYNVIVTNPTAGGGLSATKVGGFVVN